MFYRTILLGLLMLLASTVLGQAGTLDPTFADNAEIKNLNFIQNGDEIITHSITDSEDRTWIAGYTIVDEDYHIVLALLDADGNYDTEFYGTGYAVENVVIDNIETIEELALHEDKLIILSKALVGTTLRPILIKFNSDGTLQSDFGLDGIQISLIEMNPTDIAIDDAGNIYMVGTSIDDNIIVVKYFPDGVIDESFGFFGMSYIDFPSTDLSATIDLDNEGNIYVTGYGHLNGTTRGHISALTSTGATNTDFTENGRKSITWPDDKKFFVNDGLFDQATSSFYLVGRAVDSETALGNTAAVKISLEADQDMSFNDNGWLEIDLGIGGDDLANRIVKGSDGFYLAGDVIEAPEGFNSFVLHIDNEGNRVDDFGNAGISVINVIPLGADYASSLSTQSDGNIILTGIALSAEVGYFGYDARILTSNPLSNQETNQQEEISLYPNPARDFLQLSGSVLPKRNLTYRIYNTSGLLVDAGNLNALQERIAIDHLSEGAYILYLDGFRPSKWIKTN